ncbi:prepilin-type N-terminal cleavage/methylation domain-containing protein [Sulfurovum sp.]|jgi:prepilin-type N-terminal cleavage/methylation domain-containing protein|uniref:type II secretion system protein n=1 Tax=Sulfurovum sp. TaxID=1969726 RepID=UPI002A369DA7|nr:prepilin-type N-terminal cleavage/methylation domain-containing protein [Sulfurovum sp.]MDD2451649.1 prepilin-type N-terminal cleavage/methylation domain-containing protein [Sulfurovum sp.]MDD3500188.1 prepilin-type N-terminal cleavage/methylation domain-containing protein [Sulfurovum sp.]MDY0402869.1 prepilin-type N-terminal cleavage/methylation domain-containing protein [Sulfurovum sp.]
MPQLRKGFTLLELMIVVFLIVMIYALVFTYFSNEEKKPEALTPLTLKSTLSDAGMLNGHTTLLCTDECRRCYLRQGILGSFEPYENGVDLQQAELYLLDADRELSLAEYGRYKDKKISLKLDFYPNGSSTKAVLKTPGGIFYLPAYFGKPQKVDSLDEAKELWMKDTELISKTGDFY